MLKNYLKIAFRQLLRDKKYVITNILGLAVGIASCIVITLYVRGELSYDTYHTQKDRIYRLIEDNWRGGDHRHSAYTKQTVAEQFKNDIPEIEEVVTVKSYVGFSHFKKGGERYRDVELIASNSAMFDVFTFPLIYNSGKDEILDRPNTIAISKSLAGRIFGNKSPVGETLTIAGFDDKEKTGLEITGVFEDVPRNSHFGFDAVLSFETYKQTRLSLDASQFFNYLLLKPGTDLAAVRHKLQEVTETYFGKEWARKVKYTHQLQPLTDIYLGEEYAQRKGDIRYVYLFSAIALFLLFIAIINYMNLATARAAMRAKEVGIRKVSGAHRGDLVKQFMGESLIYSFFVIPVAFGLVELSLPWFNNMLNANLQWELLMDDKLVLVTIGFVLVSGLVAASYPSLILSSFQPAPVLKGDVSQGRSGEAIRKGLIVFQFVISSGLILATLMVYNQLNYIQNKKLGFEEERVVIVSLGHPQYRPPETIIKSQFLKNPSVEDASLSHWMPGTNRFARMSAAVTRLDSTNRSEMFHYTRFEPGVIPMMEIRMLAGHNFREQVSTDIENGCIINSEGVKALGWRHPADAIGKQVEVNYGENRTIIGVTENFHYRSLHQAIEPIVIFAKVRNFPEYATLNLKIKPGSMAQVIPALEDTWKAVSRGLPFTYQFLDDSIDQLYQKEKQTARLFTVFALLAIVIACLGLVGLSAYAAQQRTREMAIRKVLGAGVGNILSLLSKDFTKLVGIGFILAVPIAWYGIQQWLQKFAYQAETGWTTFLLAGIIALSVAIIAVSGQSIKVALTDPAKSLRTE